MNLASRLLAPDHEPAAPIRVWHRALAPETEQQLRRLARQRYVHDTVCAMPDAHVAKGISVGTVFATRDTLVPGALGGDLGCGVTAVRLALTASVLDRDLLRTVLRDLARIVPVGDDAHHAPVHPITRALHSHALSTRALARLRDHLGARHLGTLGGGNHFVELDRDPLDRTWLLVHTGSRGMGAAIATHHLRASGITPNALLTGVDAASERGRALWNDLQWADAFARANREALVQSVLRVLEARVGTRCEPEETIDVAHNSVSRDRFDDCTLWVHRKGATPAYEAHRGVIPGSMATASYITEGTGNVLSYRSCSHGAGRVMTRTEARTRIAPRALERAMHRVVFDRSRMRALVEEAPAAYRDITEVMDDQRELVTPVLRLEPMAVLKG